MLQVANLSKKFGTQTVLSDVNLEFKRGEFFSLLGPSGCGKTTLLRIIGGFDDFASGDLLWNGKSLKSVPPERRPFNMVFQKYALFPHLNVWDNVAFGLRLKKMPKTDLNERVEEALHQVRMDDFSSRKIQTLSGGQQQRVALARAIVNKPDILLLDESLSALDLQLRKQMQIELHDLQRKLEITFIYVTHDQEEAMTLSDRIAVMHNGRVEQVGTPEEIYECPQSPFVASFIGTINEIPASFLRHETESSVEVKIESGKVLKGRALRPIDRVDSVILLIRPERLRLRARASGSNSDSLSLPGVIKDVFFKGDSVDVLVDPLHEALPDLCVSLPRSSILALSGLPPLQRGQNVHVWWNVEDSIVMATQ